MRSEDQIQEGESDARSDPPRQRSRPPGSLCRGRRPSGAQEIKPENEVARTRKPKIVEPGASSAAEGPSPELSPSAAALLSDVGATPAPTVAALARRESAPPTPALTPSASKASPARHADGIPMAHLANMPRPPAVPPWRPGLPPASRPPGRPKERTFAEDARDVLLHGVPHKLRAHVALRTGFSLDDVACLSLRQAVILLLIVDAVEKGQLEKIDRILDRTDPKARRIEHSGAVGHLHAVAGRLAEMSEADASELYRQLVQGGGVVDVEPIEGG